MELIHHDGPREFLDRSEAWLMQAEPQHSVVLSVAHSLLQTGHPFAPPYYLATVEQDGAVVGCALRPPPDGITLTDMPVQGAPALAAALARTGVWVPDVSGPEPQAMAFAERWSEVCGYDFELACRYRWYAATEVEGEARRAVGRMRLAQAADAVWVAPWAEGYTKEVWASAVDVPAFFERRLKSRSLYVWDDGEPCAVAAVSGLTPNSARISAVYTPPRHRGHGYASTLVADVTRTVLADGKRWCVLSADAASASINEMYRRIGYKPTCETAAIGFSATG